MLPTTVSMPWWASTKSRLAGITIQPLHTHADMMLEQLAIQLAALPVPASVDNEGGDKLPEEAGDMEGDDKLPEEASSSNYAGKGGGKGDDKGLQPKSGAYETGSGQHGQQKRGGWLPKMVPLVRAIKAEDWDLVVQLAEDYSHIWSLKEFMDKADKADVDKEIKQSEWGWEAHKAHMEKEHS